MHTTMAYDIIGQTAVPNHVIIILRMGHSDIAWEMLVHTLAVYMIIVCDMHLLLQLRQIYMPSETNIYAK